jgi:hypothetical protein
MFGVRARYSASCEAEALDMELLKVRSGVLDKLRFNFRRLPA